MKVHAEGYCSNNHPNAWQIILSECPRWLIFVEGVGTANKDEFCDLCFWGENLLGLRRASIQLPLPGRLVFSPHVYGPGTNDRMYYFNTSAFPQFPDNMPAVWRQHFLGPARLAKTTLVVGEWGGVYTGKDELWQDEFKSFLLEEGLSSFYWALNPNSGDTGGLLLQDWATPSAAKVALLSELPSADVSLALAGVIPFECPLTLFSLPPARQGAVGVGPYPASHQDARQSEVQQAQNAVFRCGSAEGASSSGWGQCVHLLQACNGIAECPDHSDEKKLVCKAVGRAQPCVTVGGQDLLRPCVFPFYYRGELYHACALDDDIDGRPWCPTAVDSERRYFSFTKWGHCGPGCAREAHRRLSEGCAQGGTASRSWRR